MNMYVVFSLDNFATGMSEDIGLIFPLNICIVSIYSWIQYVASCSALLSLHSLEILDLQFFFLKIFSSYFCYQGNSSIKLDENVP